MKTLYSQALLDAWKKRAGKCLVCVAALLLAGLILCVFLCTRVRTGNAGIMLAAVIGISTVAGWLAMLALTFGYVPARAQCGHIVGILQSDTEEFVGEMRVRTEKIHIPKSVDIYSVMLLCDGESKTFYVNAALRDSLPIQPAQVRVLAARKFIMACEVIA